MLTILDDRRWKSESTYAQQDFCCKWILASTARALRATEEKRQQQKYQLNTASQISCINHDTISFVQKPRWTAMVMCKPS
eukprot:6456228-Amphidinium_carterae.1